MKKLNRFVCLTVICGVFLSYFLSPLPFHINAHRMQILDVFYFPLTLFSEVYNYLGATLNIGNVVEQNKELQERVSKLKLQLSNMQNLKRENKKLRDFLELKERTYFKNVAAEIIVKERNNFSKSVILNKGYDSNISSGAFVVAEEGLVGKIKEVGKKTSKVILIEDINFKIGARVKSTSDTGLLTGGIRDNTCYVKYLPKDSNIEKGDLVVTGRNDDFLPEGIPIGRVRGFIPSEGNFFKKAVLDSCVDFRKVKFILCLKNN